MEEKHKFVTEVYSHKSDLNVNGQVWGQEVIPTDFRNDRNVNIFKQESQQTALFIEGSSYSM